MRSIWPFRHFGLKVMSVAVALLLWLAVSGEETVERGLRVPLELQQFPSGLELLGEAPANVDVRVRGASGALSRLSAGDVVAVLDLHGAEPGRRLFHLTTEQVRAPFGIVVVQVNPATVGLAFEHSITRQLPVVPAVEGKPAPGYVVGRVRAEPPNVDVVGPETSVKRATEAVTEPVSVNGARERVRETVTVGLLDPLLRLKTPGAATVTVEVMPAPAERTFYNVPVHLLNMSPGLSGQSVPSAVDVTARGSRDGLARVESGDIIAFVDLQGLGAGEYVLTAHANATPDAGVTRIQPATLQVRLSRERD